MEWDVSGVGLSPSPFLTLPKNIDHLLMDYNHKKRYKLRNTLKNFLENNGRLIIANNLSQKIDLLETLFSLHKNRAVEKGIKSTFAGERIELFHKYLITNYNYARRYAITMDNRIVAVVYGFEFSHIFFFYQIAHDPNFNSLRLGTVLLYFVIEDCCKKGLAEFNFLQGNENYKYEWTKEERLLYGGILNRGTWRTVLTYSFTCLRSRIKTILE